MKSTKDLIEEQISKLHTANDMKVNPLLNTDLGVAIVDDIVKIRLREANGDYARTEQALSIQNVVAHFSGEERMKLQKHFVELYGCSVMAKEKANSFAVGFGKACDIIIKELNAL